MTWLLAVGRSHEVASKTNTSNETATTRSIVHGGLGMLPIRRFKRSRWQLGMLAVALVFVATALPVRQARAVAVLPVQYMAKIYTEGLGRLPEEAAWQSLENYYNANGCTVATLKDRGRFILLSAEFNGIGYDNGAKALVSYRLILNREPDLAGFNNFVAQLNAGTPLSTIIDGMFASAEFATLSTSICSATNPSYAFSTAPAIDIPTSGSGFTGTQAQLQAAINATPSGGVVSLRSKAVVRLTSPLTIKAGVTLQTSGAPLPNAYAKMGRLVRSGSLFGVPMVQLLPGARLLNVWVDGQRGSPSTYSQTQYNVAMYGGTNTRVNNNRIGNSVGATNVVAYGDADGVVNGHTIPACVTNQINGNLIEAYSSEHANQRWTDGISVGCEQTTIDSNDVVDATDVSLIIFGQALGVTQTSDITNNQTLNAGNSAYAALAADPYLDPDGTGDAANVSSRSFTGASIAGNLFWTSPRVHLDIALAVGTRAWTGVAGFNGSGGSWRDNRTGSEFAWADTGIAVSGMRATSVTGNAFQLIGVEASACPTHAIGASVSAGYASGTIQGPYADVLYWACIGH